MKKILFFALLSLSLNQTANAMTIDQAQNLIGKTGLGTSPEEINSVLNMSVNNAIDKIIYYSTNSAQLSVPQNIISDNQNIYRKDLSEYQKKQIRKKYNKQEKELKLWWYKQMITTKSPITERMTLFWHNHFTSSSKKVRKPLLMYNQNVLLRKNSLGSFRTLLHDISKDPAMIIYLDNQQNRKSKPNENFAREVMELFTLGEGNGYTENDIKEAAKAFTGWKVDKNTGEFIFDKKSHNNTEKDFMGKKGNFDGDDILDIILERPQVSVYITKKVWNEFIGINPTDSQIRIIAERFRLSNYDIKILLSDILKSSSFDDKKNYGSLIKSPVDLMVGTVRTLNIPIEEKNKNIEQFLRYGQRLGQDIFNPPNVKGWVGGKSWINSGTLPLREQLIQRITRGNEIFNRSYQEKNISSLPSSKIFNVWVDESQNYNFIQKILLPINPVKIPEKVSNKMNFVRTIVLDPTYQLR